MKAKVSNEVDPRAMAELDMLFFQLDVAILAKEQADKALAESEVMKGVERATLAEREARNAIFQCLEDNRLKNAEGHGWMVSVTVRHGYEVTDERSLANYLLDNGIYERFRTFDKDKIKKFASEYRLAHKTDLPGVESTENRFPMVRKKDEA